MMKTTLFFISFCVVSWGASSRIQIPTFPNSLKIDSKNVQTEGSKEKLKTLGDENFDPSFLLDMEEDEYSFTDPLKDPAKAIDKAENTDYTDAVIPDNVLGLPIVPESANRETASTNNENDPNAPKPEYYGPGAEFGNMMPVFSTFSGFNPANIPYNPAIPPLPGVADIAVILSNNQFFPARIRLKEGNQTRLIFTTLNKRPGALVIERLQIQRWLAKIQNENDTLANLKYEANREISSTRVTEVLLNPFRGTYSFHDALSGASGEIQVE